MNNFKRIEALLYIRGNQGVSSKDLKEVFEIPISDARKLLKEFLNIYNDREQGLVVLEFNDVFKVATREKYKDDISKMVTIIKKRKLSGASIETVGIIAYKQPMTKSQVNEIRGKSSEAVVNTLLIKGMIEEKGIAPTPGNPILYGITDKFYDYFNIKSLKELPELHDFDESEGVNDDFELFSSQREEG